MHPQKYIELYCAIVQEYMNYTMTLQNSVNQQYIYIGWKTMSHVFNRITAKYPDNLQKIYEVSRNAYLIYLEYIDQMSSAIQNSTTDLATSFNYNSAALFVYNKLNDELLSTADYSEHKDLFYKMITVMGMIFVWDNATLGLSDRRALFEKYASLYLSLFCVDNMESLVTRTNAFLQDKSFAEIDVFLEKLYRLVKKKSPQPKIDLLF